MMTLAAIKGTLRAGAYAWPGGYPIYFVACDGEPLSFSAVRENWKRICAAHIGAPKGYRDEQWAICGAEINWEDPDLYCASHK